MISTADNHDLLQQTQWTIGIFNLFLSFLFFLKLIFSKIVKYTHKVVSVPKRWTSLKLDVWVISTFLSSHMTACFRIILPSKRTKCILRQPSFQDFPGKHAAAFHYRFALLARVWSVSSLDRTLPQYWKPAYGPEIVLCTRTTRHLTIIVKYKKHGQFRNFKPRRGSRILKWGVKLL